MDDDLPQTYELIRRSQPSALSVRPAWQTDRPRFELPIWFDVPTVTAEQLIERWNSTEWAFALALAHSADALSSARSFPAGLKERPDLILTPAADLHPDLLLNAWNDFVALLSDELAADGVMVDVTQLQEDDAPIYIVRGRAG